MADAPVAPPLWLLVVVTITASISMHLVVPALAAAAADLQVSPGRMQMAVSLYLLGLAVGLLVCGPLSDAWGRRPVLLGGLALFALGGIVAACAPDLPTLLAARVLQALGACTGMALGRAVIRDTTQGEETVRRLALLGLMVMLSPGLAPLLGGGLAAAFGWRSPFAALALLGIAALWLAHERLPETARGMGPFTARRMLADYRALLGDVRFVGLIVGSGALMSSVFAFLAAAPFILTRQLHLPVTAVGLYAGLVMMGSVAGNALAGAVARRFGSVRLVLTGLAASTASAAALLMLALTHRMDLVALIGTMLVFTFGIGLAGPALMARAMSARPSLAGSAAGMFGFSQMAMGTIATSLVGLDSDPAVGCAKALLGMAVLACVGIVVGLRRGRAAAAT